MDSPMVSGTNRKWYRAVRANCRRESPTTSRSIKQSPSFYGVDVATASCRLALAASTGDRCALEKNISHSSPSAANFAANSQASSRRRGWRRVVDAFAVLAVHVICRFYSARPPKSHLRALDQWLTFRYSLRLRHFAGISPTAFCSGALPCTGLSRVDVAGLCSPFPSAGLVRALTLSGAMMISLKELESRCPRCDPTIGAVPSALCAPAQVAERLR